MEDLPAKIADLLEDVATRVRSMTVDRVQGWTKWTSVGIVLGIMALIAVTFLLVGLFRILGELITVEGAYAVVGGLFVVLGMFLWSRRTAKPAEKDS